MAGLSVSTFHGEAMDTAKSGAYIVIPIMTIFILSIVQLMLVIELHICASGSFVVVI